MSVFRASGRCNHRTRPFSVDELAVVLRPDPYLIVGVALFELPQRGVAEVTRSRPVADVQVLARLVCCAGPVRSREGAFSCC